MGGETTVGNKTEHLHQGNEAMKCEESNVKSKRSPFMHEELASEC